MMKIHTLGPDLTDSFSAATSVECSDREIICHDSFDDIIENLDCYIGEHIVIPTAYQSSKKNYGWKEFNFQYWDRLELVKLFSAPTKTMVLLKNSSFECEKSIIHPATKIYMEEFLRKHNENIPMVFAESKVAAWNLFKKDRMKYTIVSKDVAIKKTKKTLNIIEEYRPQMIWCLYKIGRM